MPQDEYVDILQPPTFEKTGQTKTLNQAWNDEDWIGTFNLWIVQKDPEPAIIYQQRSLTSSWEPGKLDVSVGGHYSAGEKEEAGLREAQEELGKNYKPSELFKMGRRINVSKDTAGRSRNNMSDIFLIIDNSPLEDYQLQEDEVSAIFRCPLDKLLQAHEDKNFTFVAYGIDVKGNRLEKEVSHQSFPYNWDNYHYKSALLIDQYLRGNTKIIY